MSADLGGAAPRRGSRGPAVLAPGAHYADADTILTIDSWDRDRETSGRITVVDGDATTTCHARLTSAVAPRALELEGGAGSGRGRLTSGTGELSVDFERWWAARGAAIVGRFEISIARGSFRVSRDGDRVTVAVRLTGRGVWRPFAAPVLLFGHGRIKRVIVTALDACAAWWNTGVPQLVAMPADELRALVTAELAKA